MPYRMLTMTNGDTVRVTESILRGEGPVGPQGPAGPPGAATTIRGHVPTAADLPPSGRQGDGYVADDTGHLWTWDMVQSSPQWVDCGRIVGPSGTTSIGACRTRTETKAIVADNSYIVEYTAMPYNDADPLEGMVLDEGLCTATTTVVANDNPTYYLVINRFSIEAEVENPVVIASWRNATTATVTSLETHQGFEWEISLGSEGDVVLPHVAVLKTSNDDAWQFVLKPDENITLLSAETIWTRIGGGQGPQGLHGDPPTLFVGTVTNMPYGSNPTFTLTEESDGVYRVDVGLPQGPQGIAGAGYTTFNEIVQGGNSEANPGGSVDYVTDQQIPIPDGTNKPAVPWYLNLLVTNVYRRLVSRLTTTQRTARGTPESGEVVFDTDTRQFLGGQNNAWFIVPTIEYGQSSAVYHGAATTRPNGSLYFKHES